jgi:hypothetical protein
MSAFGGRRAPNVSQYIANLNTTVDMASDPFDIDTYGLDDDLAAFTNTEFFDFDMGEPASMTPLSPLNYDAGQEERARRQNASAYHKHNGRPLVDFSSTGSKPVDHLLDGDFQFDDFSNIQNVVHDPSMAAMTTSSSSHYPMTAMSPVTPSTASSNSSDTYGGKRKVDPMSDPNSALVLEEATRVAAEEDKRRRNTAASARFRIKKKQREQALEKQAKEMTDKVSNLEKKVSQLETENKWLKGLITEKNDNRGDIAELYKRFTMDGSEPRSTGGRTDGVGTDSRAANATKA